MSTYVLIHGAWHGGWCWEKVKPLLEQAGHTVLTPDLPGHGRDGTPPEQVSLQAYADHVCNVVRDAGEPVILVGHSMGGVVISQAAEQCGDQVDTLVYLGAFLLPNGETLLGMAQTDHDSLVTANLVVAENGASATVKDEAIKPAFYADCSDEDVANAKARLLPQALAPFVTPLSLSGDQKVKTRVFIETTEDRAIPIGLQRRMTAAQPDVRVITMGTSHSPFFSAPEELARHLQQL